MTYEVKNASGVTIAMFESIEEAKVFASTKPGCTVHTKGLQESTQLVLPILLTE